MAWMMREEDWMKKKKGNPKLEVSSIYVEPKFHPLCMYLRKRLVHN